VDNFTKWPSYHIYKHYFPSGQITDCSKVSIAYGEQPYCQHAGACCIKREVLKDVQWKANDKLVLAPANRSKAEDYEFCMEVLFKMNRSMMIDAKLYSYRTV
jgi:hypothetical protein